MPVLNALIERELHSWFTSPVFYAHCFLFSFFSLASMFLLGSFIEVNQADLSHSFFRWLPWIFAMTAPVIGIRSWSEEHQGGLFEVLGTQPISTSQLIIAKSTGAFMVVFFSLLLTLPAVFTVIWLGEPDIGMIASGYLGAFLCGCAFTGLSQAICSFMRGSIGAYVCSVAICLVLILSGTGNVANIIMGTFPSLEWVTELLAALSISPKYDPFTEGRIELSAVLGFVLLIIVAMLFSVRVLLVQRAVARSSLFKRLDFKYGLPVSGLLSLYLVLAFAFSFFQGRLDVTEDGRFSLPSAVSTELKNLQRDVTVRLFATKRHPQFGFELTRYEERINEAMSLVVEHSENKVSFEVLDPNYDARAARIAAIDQVQSTGFNGGEPFMFGMVVESLNQKRVFDAIDPSREKHLIADLVQAILDVARIDKKRIAVISAFDNKRNDGLAMQHWTALNALSTSYDLHYISVDDDLSDMEMVILHHPADLTQKQTIKLEQFLDQKGDIIVLADPYSLMSNTFSQSGVENEARSNLPIFVKKRGISMRSAKTVYDVQLQTAENIDGGSINNPAVLTLGSRQFNPDHAMTAGFDYVQFLQAGVLDILPIEGYNTVELIRSSKQALLLDTSIANDRKSINHVLGNITPLASGYPLMVIQTSEAVNSKGRLVVVSDIDWLHEAISGAENTNGELEVYNANIGLMRNIVDYLTGNRALRELKLRSLTMRPLQEWNDMQSAISEPFREPIAGQVSVINTLQGELDLNEHARQMASQKGKNNIGLANQQASLTQKLRIAEAEMSRLHMQREAKVQKRLSLIKWSNVLVIPLLILLLGLIVTQLRYRKIRGSNA